MGGLKYYRLASFSIMTLGITAFSIMTFGITTLSIMTFSIIINKT
jgi:hypothetical protein